MMEIFYHRLGTRDGAWAGDWLGRECWIEEKAGMANRVIAQEVKVVQRLTDAYELIEPLQEI
jgi:hypothetical protein